MATSNDPHQFCFIARIRANKSLPPSRQTRGKPSFSEKFKSNPRQNNPRVSGNSLGYVPGPPRLIRIDFHEPARFTGRNQGVPSASRRVSRLPARPMSGRAGPNHAAAKDGKQTIKPRLWALECARTRFRLLILCRPRAYKTGKPGTSPHPNRSVSETPTEEWTRKLGPNVRGQARVAPGTTGTRMERGNRRSHQALHNPLGPNPSLAGPWGNAISQLLRGWLIPFKPTGPSQPLTSPPNPRKPSPHRFARPQSHVHSPRSPPSIVGPPPAPRAGCPQITRPIDADPPPGIEQRRVCRKPSPGPIS